MYKLVYTHTKPKRDLPHKLLCCAMIKVKKNGYSCDDIERTHLETIKSLYENGCLVNTHTCSTAAANGHLECLKYAHKNGCPWDERTCSSAAKNGHLECLKYAHENGCPWGKHTCYSSAANGHLECLKYLHEHGFPWNENTCSRAAANGHFKCLKYAYESGCPYPKQLNIRRHLMCHVWIPKWRAAVKVRAYAFHWMNDTARTLCAAGGKGRKRDLHAFESDFTTNSMRAQR